MDFKLWQLDTGTPFVFEVLDPPAPTYYAVSPFFILQKSTDKPIMLSVFKDDDNKLYCQEANLIVFPLI